MSRNVVSVAEALKPTDGLLAGWRTTMRAGAGFLAVGGSPGRKAVRMAGRHR
jgi:hypothetical protein